jgi:hypothetical protein
VQQRYSLFPSLFYTYPIVQWFGKFNFFGHYWNNNNDEGKGLNSKNCSEISGTEKIKVRKKLKL